MHALFNLWNDLLIGRLASGGGSQSDIPMVRLFGPNKFRAHNMILRHIFVRMGRISRMWNGLTLGSATYNPLTPLTVAVVIGPSTRGDMVKI